MARARAPSKARVTMPRAHYCYCGELIVFGEVGACGRLLLVMH